MLALQNIYFYYLITHTVAFHKTKLQCLKNSQTVTKIGLLLFIKNDLFQNNVVVIFDRGYLPWRWEIWAGVELFQIDDDVFIQKAFGCLLRSLKFLLCSCISCWFFRSWLWNSDWEVWRNSRKNAWNGFRLQAANFSVRTWNKTFGHFLSSVIKLPNFRT